MPHRVVRPVIDHAVRLLCARPYPGHPRGCPNHARRATCPPRARTIERVLDLSRDVRVAWNDFDLAGHVERMRRRHPEWSQRQLACCLYWQGTARKHLREEIARARRRIVARRGEDVVEVTCPEARGVNVTETMRLAGVELEWPPVRVARQVALVGVGAKQRRRSGRGVRC